MTRDDDAQVRYQLAFTLGEVPVGERISGIAHLLAHHGGDRWLRLACLSSLQEGAAAVLAKLLSDGDFRRQSASAEIFNSLAVQIGRGKQPAELGKLLKSFDAIPAEERFLVLGLLEGIESALKSQGTSLAKLLSPDDAALADRLKEAAVRLAKQLVEDPSKPVDLRTSALHGLSLAKFEEIEALLVGLLSPQTPQGLQAAALQTLGSFDHPGIAEILSSAWPSLAPNMRRAALDVMIARPQRAKALLEAVANKQISAGEIDRTHVELLKLHPDPAVRERAKALFTTFTNAQRDEVIEQYRPLLKQQGDKIRGKELFAKNCAACHKVEGIGHELGPNLAAMKNRGAEAILLNLLDPNREVNPQFLSYIVVTTDGRTLSGLIAAESANSITLKRAEGVSEEVLRSDIEELRGTGLSLMPEGLEKQLDQRAMADIIAYLLSLK